MIQKIVLVRHGESEVDKMNPQRGLTKKGVEQIQQACIEIMACVPGIRDNLEVFTSDTTRTVMSAKVVASYFGLSDYRKLSNMRIGNIGVFVDLVGQVADTTAIYFDYFKKGKLPDGIQTPGGIADNILNNINQANAGTENLIIVGHGTSLESFAYFQEVYIPNIPYTKELEYGGWLLLQRKNY